MKVTKTIHCGVVKETKIKYRALESEYNNLQDYLQGDENAELYSANKQQADRYYEKVDADKEYPISIRKDLIDIEPCESDVCDYFVKVPTKFYWGGMKLPVKTGREIPDDWEVCESKLYCKDGNFYINITLKKEIAPISEYNGVLGIDLGLRNPITGVTLSVAESNPKVMFRGDIIKQIQTRYFWLRRQSKTGKGWEQREHHKVEDQLHKITTKIADYALQNRLIVVAGELEGIQKRDLGCKMNRKLHGFPHFTFRQMLEYKCKERGLLYTEVSEAYTSQTCYKCGERGVRKGGLFKCNGSELNADVNGAINIGKRALGKSEIRSMLSVGAFVARPGPNSNEPTSTFVDVEQKQVGELAGTYQ